MYLEKSLGARDQTMHKMVIQKQNSIFIVPGRNIYCVVLLSTFDKKMIPLFYYIPCKQRLGVVYITLFVQWSC